MNKVVTLKLIRERFKLKDKDKPRVNLKYLALDEKKFRDAKYMHS